MGYAAEVRVEAGEGGEEGEGRDQEKRPTERSRGVFEEEDGGERGGGEKEEDEVEEGEEEIEERAGGTSELGGCHFKESRVSVS